VPYAEQSRYTVTYDPSVDRIIPTPNALHVRIKNTSSVALRAAYLHGPFTLHAATYPQSFNPNQKLANPRQDGIPQFEPNLKCGGNFTAKLTIPEDLRIKSLAQANEVSASSDPKTVTWIIEITSQILFSASAHVKYELFVARDEKSLDYNFLAMPSNRHADPGQIKDLQERKHRRRSSTSTQPKGVYSRAINLVVDDIESLWSKPGLPVWEKPATGRKSLESSHRKSLETNIRPKTKKKKKIHLVVLTHGLHSNVSADMLYMKESLDATAKAAVESRAKRRANRTATGDSSKSKATASKEPTDTADASTAPLSGGQEDLQSGQVDDTSDDDEEILVRGFPGNVVKTEKGIQYLGKRLAKYLLDFTYPDQPFKPLKKRSMTQKLSDSMTAGSKKPDPDPGVPTHEHSSIRKEPGESDLAYTFTSISFIGHSLGGLVQLYAIAYIQKHAPNFFDKIKPVNFIAMASPFLGLSNENPMYVKYALNFGLVGRTGQDLGLMWRPPTLAKSGWTALVGGIGGQKSPPEEDPGAKPLLRILPTGPAHVVLRKFRNRTVYSNVVNDGIVPLRTSCLLFLDWRGLGKAQRARRDNGLIGTVIGWGWAEVMGQSQTPNQSTQQFESELEDSQDLPPELEMMETTVPQPSENAVNEDDERQSLRSIPSKTSKSSSLRKSSHGEPSAIDSILNFLRPTAKTTKKDMKMFKRSQTIHFDDALTTPSQSSTPSGILSPASDTSNSRPLATRGDSVGGESGDSNAPPKTTIFESAADILSPPIPPTSWIIDPSTRARTIFHDRIYHPEDIPAPPSRKPTKSFRSLSNNSQGVAPESSASLAVVDESGMRVEEKIARAYHRDLSWRKVLVRLEPDAHNNMIVRRMFANAYGWPVVKHLCDTHFGDTYAARTRDEDEPASDRAKGLDVPVGKQGEHVTGQESRKEPDVGDHMMRRASSEMKPLREQGVEAVLKKAARDDSIEIDETYLEDTESEDEDNRSPFQKLWSSAPPKSPSPNPEAGGKKPATNSPAPDPDDDDAILDPQVADVLTKEPSPIDALRATSVSSSGTAANVGLKKPVEELIAPEPGSAGPSVGIAEQVARLGKPDSKSD
jgi:hypothetical protein